MVRAASVCSGQQLLQTRNGLLVRMSDSGMLNCKVDISITPLPKAQEPSWKKGRKNVRDRGMEGEFCGRLAARNVSILFFWWWWWRLFLRQDFSV